jgi:hypothetical protein
MGYSYDKEMHFDEERDVVFCWLRSDEKNVPPVRVEVSREYIEDNWHLGWNEREKIKAEFEKRRAGYLEPASKAAGGSDTRFRVYKIHNDLRTR